MVPAPPRFVLIAEAVKRSGVPSVCARGTTAATARHARLIVRRMMAFNCGICVPRTAGSGTTTMNVQGAIQLLPAARNLRHLIILLEELQALGHRVRLPRGRDRRHDAGRQAPDAHPR